MRIIKIENFRIWLKKGALTLLAIFLILIVVLTVSIQRKGYFKSFPLVNSKNKEAVVLYNPFEKLSIKARAVYVFDAGTGRRIYSQNEDEALPLASITKIMTVLTAYKILPLESEIKVKVGSMSSTTEADANLTDGEKWTLKELLDYTLVGSSNSGAGSVASFANARIAAMRNEVVAKHYFVDEMNRISKELGLNSMKFENATGLDVDETRNGGYGSAKDVALLVKYVLKNRPTMMEATTLSHTAPRDLSGKQYFVQNTNILSAQIPTLVASKTGYTGVSGGNLVIAFEPEPGRAIIISVLGSTAQGRFEDVSGLVTAVYEYLSFQKKLLKV